MNRTTTSADTPVISMKDLAVGYNSKAVLSNITASIHRGQFVSILGPNGAGKSTLLRTLSRHLHRISGTIIINGRSIEAYRQKDLAASLAVVLTSRLDTELFTGFEFTAMGRHPHTGLMGALTDRDRERVWESLRLVNAVDLAERQMDHLSDGEKQKLFIARALAQEPQIVVLDEPTAHLDLKHKMEIMTILRDSCRGSGITVIASLHDVGIAARVSDQVALVKNGTVVAWGSPEEVLRGPVVAELYEIDGAVYDRTTATIEMKGTAGRGKVFCVSGSGTGAVLYRSLVRNSIDVSTGVLHENDVDCHIARAICTEVVTAPAFEKVTPEMAQSCTALIGAADCLVDTGFPAGEMNRENIRLLEHALETGKRVFSLRRPEDLAALRVPGSERVTIVNGEQALIEQVLRMRS